MHKFGTEAIDTPKGARRLRTLVREGETVSRQERPMARNYITTDPFEIAERLRGAGWTATVEDGIGRKIMKANKWTAFVRFWDHKEDGHLFDPLDASPYRTGGIWACNHSGRARFAGLPGTVRLYCLNQFPGAMSNGHCSWQHTDERLQYVLDHIETFSSELALQSRRTFVRLGKLLRSTDSTYYTHTELLNEIMVSKPRLGTRVAKAYNRYSSEGPTAWALMQALTEVRSQTTAALAHTALGRDWEAYSMGMSPPSWRAILN